MKYPTMEEMRYRLGYPPPQTREEAEDIRRSYERSRSKEFQEYWQKQLQPR